MPNSVTETENAADRKRKSGCTGWLLLAAILSLILGGIAIGGPAFRRYQLRANLPPGFAALVDDALTREVEIPPKWKEPKHYSPELIARTKELLDVWQRDQKLVDPLLIRSPRDRIGAWKRMCRKDEWTTVVKITSATRDLIDHTTAVVRMPGYDIGVYTSPQISLVSFEEYGRPLSFEYLLCLTSLLAAHERQWDAAAAHAVDGLRLNRFDDLSLPWSDALEGIHEALTCVSTLATSCTERAPLNHILAEARDLNRWNPHASLSEFYLASLTARTNAWQTAGYSLTCPEKATLAFRLKLDIIETPKYLSWALLRVRPGSLEHTRIEDQLQKCWKAPSLYVRFRQFLLPEEFFLEHEIGYVHVIDDECSLKAEYDLTVLKLACRIRELSGDTQTSGTVPVLVPRYLPEMPIDPFSSKPYLWHEVEKCFYSIGADRRDDHMAQRSRYNGDGDIATPRLCDEY